MPNSPHSSDSDHKIDGFWGILEGGTRLRTLLVLASGAFLLVMLGNLLVPLLLGAILAAITWPLRDRLVRILRGRIVLASMILEIVLVVGILTPIVAILLLAVAQVRDLYASTNLESLTATITSVFDALQRLPLLSRIGLRPEVVVERLQAELPKLATWGVGRAAQFSMGLLQTSVMLALMLLCLFYLHISGDRLAERVRKILPLPEGETASLMDVFRRTAVAILKGNFVIAAIQGLLTGGLFVAVGIPSSVFFGVLTALCSLVPSVGSALVWFPAGVILLLSGSWIEGIVVLLVGMLVISMIDNILRPILVGRDTGMHDLMVLLTTLGGIGFFGPIGILFGPLVGAVFLALLERHEMDLAEASERASSSR